jgi:hypothetical protein
MECYVTFEIVWQDVHSIKLRISAWNGYFGGAADVYAGIGQLGEAAVRLEGFPQNTSDVRELEFGTFKPEYAGGGVNLRFFCTDSSGHSVVRVRIASEPNAHQESQAVLLFAPVEAAAVDVFVHEMRQLETAQQGVAHLRSEKQSAAWI